MNIKEVARHARVSTATVSRTINGSERVRPATAAHVMRVIEELKFYPNTQARSLVSGRSRILGLIISDISNPFFPQLVKSFEESAIQQGHEVLVANTDYDAARMSLCVRRMLERKVDGVAIMTSEMDRRLTNELARRGVPIVFLDVGRVSERISNISIDYAEGIREAVQHLIALGHSRIAFISGPLELKSARLRRSAFLKYLANFGITEDRQLIVEGNHKFNGGQDAMRRLLSLRRPPTAVLTSNDLTAIGTLSAITSQGLRVPQDVSLIGFDGIAFSEYTSPPLTTVEISLAELGKKAFDALYHVLNGKSQDGREYKVSTRLIIRESTGQAKKSKRTR